MKKIFIWLLMIILLSINLVGVSATTNTTFTVENINAEVGNVVNVPIKISNNQGILATKLTVSYDSKLTLTNITTGDALTSLVMTKPGNLTLNPFNLVWDGIDVGDSSNGTVAILTFSVPNIAGTYNIGLTVGKTFGDDTSPIYASTINGSIVVGGSQVSQTSTISVGSVSGGIGDTVTVPISISNNPGVFGGKITITYDSGITLTGASNGEAFAHLVMTKPGQFVSPCNFLWDGQDMVLDDVKDGTILNLQFKINETAKGGDIYGIAVSYKKNQIFDMNFNSLDFNLESGKVNVKSSNCIELKVGGKQIVIDNEKNLKGTILIAFYDIKGKLLSFSHHSSDEQNINVENTNANYAKVMFWNGFQSIIPLCDAQIVNLK